MAKEDVTEWPTFAHAVVMLHLIMRAARGMLRRLIHDAQMGGSGAWSVT
jgi:hypothetical protein